MNEQIQMSPNVSESISRLTVRQVRPLGCFHQATAAERFGWVEPAWPDRKPRQTTGLMVKPPHVGGKTTPLFRQLQPSVWTTFCKHMPRTQRAYTMLLKHLLAIIDNNYIQDPLCSWVLLRGRTKQFFEEVSLFHLSSQSFSF